MPNCCHPNAPHTKLKAPDWYVSALMLDRALDAILRRVKNLDRDHDIPYLAGYSTDGKTIYIDRHLPKSFVFRGRTVDVDQIATRAEEAAVNAERITWAAYDRFMQKYVKSIGDERLVKVPADLDLKPYRDYHDYDLMQRMLEHIDGKPGLGAKLKGELKVYAAAFREQHRVEQRHLAGKTAGSRKVADAGKPGVPKKVPATKKAPAKKTATVSGKPLRASTAS